MYDELVKRLRNRRICIQQSGSLDDFPLLQEAAHVIEKLSKTLADHDEMLHAYRHVCNGLSPDEVQKRISQPRWISVEERLPDSGTCVLVTDGLEVGEGWITEIINTKGHFSRWCCPTTDIDVDWRPITHWMPLPEPPKEET